MIKADKINYNYYYPDQFKESAEEFLNAYVIEKEISCPVEKIKGLKDKKSRLCRFCNKKYPFVAFSKDAHIFSELLGNKYLVSDFECDDCNSKFGRYENDLANFLGIVRTIQSVKAKKIPKFKSADKKLEAESTIDPEEGTIVKVRRFDGLNKTFQFNKEKQQTEITYEKGPYTPLHVYKAILKMALSIIDEKDLLDYRFTMEYLRTNKYDIDYSGFAIVASYQLPLTFQFEQPTGMLFRKKESNSKLFTHVFYFCALNFIYQIAIPLNRQDARFHTSGKVETLWCPPLFGNDKESQHLSSHSLNLNSVERLYRQQEILILPTREGEYDKSRFIDKETGKVHESDFDGTKIVGIDMIRVDDPND